MANVLLNMFRGSLGFFRNSLDGKVKIQSYIYILISNDGMHIEYINIPKIFLGLYLHVPIIIVCFQHHHH